MVKNKWIQLCAILSVFVLLLALTSFKAGSPVSKNEPIVSIENLSVKLNVNSKAIELAIKGYEKLKQLGQLNNQRYLTIADMSKASSEPRLFIIDMEKQVLVLQTFVAHGRNSGMLFAKKFSNKIGSFQSSMGFYITGSAYKGKHGKSLVLKGVESGINDNAEQRAIVLHGAAYANKGFVNQQGYLGRSLGCPAVPNNQVEAIIKTIQGASCLFVYAADNSYLKKSSLIN
jgi:L,D-transpeptidase catalytic domain